MSTPAMNRKNAKPVIAVLSIAASRGNSKVPVGRRGSKCRKGCVGGFVSIRFREMPWGFAHAGQPRRLSPREYFYILVFSLCLVFLASHHRRGELDPDRDLRAKTPQSAVRSWLAARL